MSDPVFLKVPMPSSALATPDRANSSDALFGVMFVLDSTGGDITEQIAILECALSLKRHAVSRGGA